MRFRSADQDQFVFQLGKREKALLLELLRFYPLLPASHHCQRHPSTTESASNTLIEEALAQHRSEAKQQLESMMANPARFTETETGWDFSIRLPELDWLLQVLNDIYVGSWVALGSPDPKKEMRIQISGENARYLWAMELCGHFERVLLYAVTHQPPGAGQCE